MSVRRMYDVILWGSTGFTGRLVAEYLSGAQHSALRWAVAGVCAMPSSRTSEIYLSPSSTVSAGGRLESTALSSPSKLFDFSRSKSVKIRRAAKTHHIADEWSSGSRYSRWGQRVPEDR